MSTRNPGLPNCIICGQPMILGTNNHYRCIYYPHDPSKSRLLFAALDFVILGLAILFVASGCTTTITPPRPKPTQASFDGGQQNSGYLGTVTNVFASQTNISARITLHARDRYNALIVDYGQYFKPPLKPGEGVSATSDPNVFLIDQEHLVKFLTLNRWRKEGKPPL